MIVRLAFKNTKKSMSDDIVYFVTLVLGICMYYVFAAVSVQPDIQEVLQGQFMNAYTRYLSYLLPFVRIVVLTVFVGLIAYANRFRMNRRKREFGMYLLLGMKKRRIAGILFLETAFVGGASLVFGIVTGIVLSQGMSVFVSNLFEADLSHLTFLVSGEAMVETVLCFCGVYVLVYGMNLLMTCRLRLIQLFQAGRCTREGRIRPVLCFIVFVGAAVLLGRVYYMVTVRLEELLTPWQIYAQLAMLFAGTVLLFWSLSGFFVFAARGSRRFYLGGIHAFTVREISGRFHTNVLGGSLICFLVFLAISLVSSSFLLCQNLNAGLKALVPADVCFEMCVPEALSMDADITGIGERFEKQGIDTSMFRDAVEVTLYKYYEWDEQEGIEYLSNTMLFAGEEIMKLSDYNKLAKLYGKKTHSLSEHEYFVVSNRERQRQWCNRYYLSKNHVITLGGTEYFPKYTECQDGFLRFSYFSDNFGFTVVPDTLAPDKNIHPASVFYVANYCAADAEEAERIDAYVKSSAFLEKVSEGEEETGINFAGTYRSDIIRNGRGVAMMTVFLGLYIGFSFVMISAALFSLKELTQVVESWDKYRTLWHLGVSRRMLRQSLFFQNAVFFSIPYAVAVLHAVFGSWALKKLLYAFTDVDIIVVNIPLSICGTIGLLTLVYLLYFVITYRSSRKVIEERIG